MDKTDVKIEEPIVQRTKKKGQMKTIWTRYKKNKLAMVGLVMLVIMLFVAATADIFFDYNEDAVFQNMTERLETPNADHLLGTDQYGRDILARIVFGSRISLTVGLVTIAIGLTFGSLIGAIAGYYGGKIDNILMRIMDVFLAIPSMLLAICIVAALGGGLFNLLLASGVSQIARFSRIVRSAILTMKDQEFIEAARACGTKDSRIITRHILPNAIGPIIVQATLTMASAILVVSSLSFVGLGITPPTPEWG
ncbi:MAG: ABC transporter permease, partial [Oscillospiraceae bacterium]